MDVRYYRQRQTLVVRQLDRNERVVDSGPTHGCNYRFVDEMVQSYPTQSCRTLM
jgi:hypothetical protein